ncbi:probable G-protein coupled receptor 156 [Asterias amurensis]|uniref:probable G-protein coupled receptor 156 n=1 Tax=Asterias amurensis TaxID=7602 RepID=UPI003AB68890
MTENASLSNSLVLDDNPDDTGGMDDVIIRAISPILLGVMSSLALFGIILAISFLSFNIKYRQSRLIKMSSPNLNIFIGIGAILVYACVVLFGIDVGVTSSDDVLLFLCKVRVPLLTVGFTLVYGSIFSKAWRVYRIFTHAAAKRMVIRDGRLMSMVGVLLFVDVVVLVTWLILDPPQIHRKMILTASSEDAAAPLSSREALQFCQSNNTGIWFTILFSFKAAILLMGTYLSWETRNVTVPSMNDAKCIVLSVYTCVILVAMATALMAVLEAWPNAWYSCLSVVMLVCPTELLLMQYIPKIRAMRNNPDVSYSMSRSLTTSYLATSQHRSFAEVEEELFLLSKENASLKRALGEKDNTIKMLHEHVASARKKLYLLSIDPEQRQDSGCDFDMSSSSTCPDDREIIGLRPPDVVEEESPARDFIIGGNRQGEDPHKLSVKHNDAAAMERQNLKRRRGRDGGSIRSTGSMRSQQSVQQFEDLRESIVKELHHAHDLSLNLREAITHDLQSCRTTPMYMVIADTERELAGVLKDSYKLDGDNISISSSTFTYDNPVFTRNHRRRHSTNSLCVCNSRQSSFRSVASLATDMTIRDGRTTPSSVSRHLQWPQYIPPKMSEGARETPHVVNRSPPAQNGSPGKVTKSVYHTYV